MCVYIFLFLLISKSHDLYHLGEKNKVIHKSNIIMRPKAI